MTVIKVKISLIKSDTDVVSVNSEQLIASQVCKSVASTTLNYGVMTTLN
jgi:hypothetical protein